MNKTTANRALDFVIRCINETGADGYQTWENDAGDVPDGITPDDISHNGNVLYLVFGDEVYVARFRKVRSR